MTKEEGEKMKKINEVSTGIPRGERIKGIVSIQIECVCGQLERFWGKNFREVFEREETAGWQHSPKVIGGIYRGMCPECSSDPMLGIEGESE